MIEKLLTACVTPFNELYEIDMTSLGVILKQQAACGNGIILFGSTGEGLSLTLEEKIAILDYACSLNLGVSIFVGVAFLDISIAISFIKHCNSFPISGFLISPPPYYKPGIHGQTVMFRMLLEATSKNVILYNIPSRSGVRLFPEVIQSLLSYKNLIAIKDSGGICEYTSQYINVFPNGKIFCGDDSCFFDMKSVGCYGLVSVIANIWPGLVAEGIRCEFENESWQDMSYILSAGVNPIPVKYVLYRHGIISTPIVRMPLSSKDVELSVLNRCPVYI